VSSDTSGDRLPSSYFEPLPKSAHTSPPPTGFYGAVPGFRSATWWKAAIATVFYGLCLLGVLAGLVGFRIDVVTLFLAALGIPVFVIQLVRFWRVRIVNLGLIAGLVLSFASFGVSVAMTPASVASTSSSRSALETSPTPRPETSTSLAAAPTSTPTTTPIPSAAPTLAPTPPPTPTPRSTPTAPPVVQTPTPAPPPAPRDLCGAPPNPWNYNFCSGAVINSPSSNFCQYFNCILSFWQQTAGYVEQCTDGTYSHSGGRSGSCSSHGGNARALLQ